jgi:hypothetical protein
MSSIQLEHKISVTEDHSAGQNPWKWLKNQIPKQTHYQDMRELKVTILKNFVFLLEIFWATIEFPKTAASHFSDGIASRTQQPLEIMTWNFIWW